MNSKTNSYDRLRQLRDWLRLEFPKIKEAAIERKMGLATNYFKTRERAQKSHGDKQLHAQTIEKIKEAWEEQKPDTPQLNIDWLVNGTGEMFTDMQIVNQTKDIPYYDDDFIQSRNIDKILQKKPKYYINLPPYNRIGNLCLTVTGNAMSPSINSGDRIIMQAVDGTSNIVYGETYAIVTNNDMRAIRRIVRSPEQDMLRLVPDSADPRYGDYQDIPISEIKIIFQVLCIIRAF